MTILHKILFGYSISVAIIGSMTAILLHERNRIRGIEANTAGINSVRRNVTPATGSSRNLPREKKLYSAGMVRILVLIIPNVAVPVACCKYLVKDSTLLCVPTQSTRCRAYWRRRRCTCLVQCARGGSKRSCRHTSRAGRCSPYKK